MKQQTLGAVATVLALGSACAQTTTSTAADGGGARDATADVVAPACGLAPLVDLDREGIVTPDGVAAWVDFSRASDLRLVTPIATCGGGEVRLPVMVRWTAPRAGYLRVRVQRDRPDETGTRPLLTVRRLANCGWDAEALGCLFDGFRQDPTWVRGEYEFPVTAGPQWLVFAWTFGYRGLGLERAIVPALRVAVEITDASAYGASCGGWSAGGEAFCPARSTCAPSAAGPLRCLPDGSAGGACRIFPFRGCDEGLGCNWESSRCVSAGGPGTPCDHGECRAGSSCPCILCGHSQVCQPDGSARARCRDATDPRGECDPSLVCVRSLDPPFCVATTPSGALCDSSSFCADGGTCLPVGSGVTRCVPPGSEGTRCIGPRSTPCLPGLRCFTGECVRLLPRGTACTSDSVCEPGLACVGGECGDPTPERCAEHVDSCPAGQACLRGRCYRAFGIGEDPDREQCLPGLSMDDEHRCAVVVPSVECQEDVECQRGTVCRDNFCVVEGMCPQPRRGGSASGLSGVVCGTEARCVTTSDGTVACRPVGRAGGLCRRDAAAACDEGHRCVGGVCVAASSKSGGVCADHLACPPGTHCDLGCVPAAGVGQEGGRCRRGAEGRGECDGGLRCDPATLTCSR